MSDRTAALLAMLDRGQDSALLRYSLGTEYFARDEYDEAHRHLLRAVELDREYSAAWKLLGRTLAAADRPDDAMAAFRTGIAVAEQKGDRQAAKEMQVFLKRLEKKAGG